MKKSKYLSLLAVSLLLVGCGTASSSSETSPSDLSSVEPSFVEPALTQVEVDEKLGDAAKLKSLLSSYAETGVKKLVVSTDNAFGLSTTEFQYKSKEILTSTKEVDTDGVETEYGSYTGVVGNKRYYLSIDLYGSSISVSNLYNSFEEIPEDDWEGMTYAQAEEEYANTVSAQTDLSQSTWSDFFTENESEDPEINNGVVYDSYSATLDSDKITIRSKAHQTAYSDSDFSGYYDFTFVAEFDTDFAIKDGSLTVDYYDAKNCNAETKLPNEGAEKNPHKSSVKSLVNIELGEVEASGSEAMIDLTPYFTSSLTQDAHCVSEVYDDSIQDMKTSNRNEIYAGCKVQLNFKELDERYNSIYYVLPETAADAETLEIKSSSNMDAITYGPVEKWFPGSGMFEDAWYAKEDAVGQSSVLTIGTATNPNVGQITVTVVAAPSASEGGEGGSQDRNDALINIEEDPYLVNKSDGTFDFSEGLTITCEYETWMVFPTENNAPFDDYSELYSVEVADSSVAEVSLDYPMGKQNGFNAVAVKFVPLKAGSTTFNLRDAKGEVMFSFALTVSWGESNAISTLKIVNDTGVEISNLYVHDAVYYALNNTVK